MRKIGDDIEKLICRLSPDEKQAKINIRARQVRERYKAALQSVYRDQANLFLEHTNNVYILKKEGVKTLIVYVDESIFAAELNAQRELIKLKLLELFGEEVEDFSIHVSRGVYRSYYPYVVGEQTKKLQPLPLNQTEIKQVEDTVSIVEDKNVRESLKKAMKADIEWRKAENANLIENK